MTLSILLVRPQLPENIGMCARAMLNCSVTDLRLIQPLYDPMHTKSRATASGALSVLESTQIYNSLNEAVHDIHFVLGTTARRRDMFKPVYPLAEGITTLQSHTPLRTGIIFGCESSGLSNEETTLCNGFIDLTLNKNFSSFNLAQAVLLCTYAWSSLQNKTEAKHIDDVAPKKDVIGFIKHMEEALDKKGYFFPENKRTIMQQNLHNMFTRHLFTTQEIRTLRGIISTFSQKEIDN